ncbi:glycosyltransferase family 39 protein [Actinomycetospora lutea]|uniref:glycosyltransferase family 39 protein n=1 Tax=Actinomycetospora lutea TaxID=663604 RepID=UPI0023672405|nr:glycosyltransferase family 39 protein [Actinomycetospora lutea]MDD7940889.1 glycosyltransferase family 39 protein [Actinomycetospora lutea]
MTRVLALASRALRPSVGVSLVVLVVLRVAAGLVLDAGDVDLYEFGVIAAHWVDGDGFSYFTATPAGVVAGVVPGGTPLPGAYMPPAYVVVVAAATALARAMELGPDGLVWLVRAANILLAGAGLLAISVLVRSLADARTARIACLLFAVYPTFVYQTTQVSASNLYIPLEIGLLAGLSVLAGAATWRRLVVVGVGLGLLCLMRSEAVALIPLVAIWSALAARPLTSDRRSRLTVAAVVVVVAVALPTAWAVRNSMVLGEPVVTTTTTGGLNLWSGNHEGASGSQKDAEPPPDLQARLAALAPSRAYEKERDDVLLDEAWDHIAADPGGTVLLDVRKFVMQVTVDLTDPRSTNPVYLGGYLLVAVFGVWGWGRWWRRAAGQDARARRWLIVGYAVTSLAVPTVFFALARYRLPFEVVLVIGTALFLATVLDDPRTAGRRPREGSDSSAAGAESFTGT